MYFDTKQILCIWIKYKYCLTGQNANIVYLCTIKIIFILTQYTLYNGHDSNTVHLDTIKILCIGHTTNTVYLDTIYIFYLGTIQILCIWKQYKFCFPGHNRITVYLDIIQIPCYWTQYKKWVYGKNTHILFGHDSNTAYLDTL